MSSSRYGSYDDDEDERYGGQYGDRRRDQYRSEVDGFGSSDDEDGRYDGGARRPAWQRSGRGEDKNELPYGGRLDMVTGGEGGSGGGDKGGRLGRGGSQRGPPPVSGAFTVGWRRDKMRGFLATAKQDNWKVVVMKATNRDVCSPKAKHVRTIMDGVDFGGSEVMNRETGSGAVLYHLQKRTKEKDWLVATKALSVFHFVLREATNVQFLSTLTRQERATFQLDDFQDEYPEGFAFVKWVKSYGQYLFQWCVCKAEIDYPPTKREEEKELDEEIYPKRFVSMKAKDLLKALPKLLLVLDKMFRLDLAGVGGQTPVSAAAIGMVSKDLAHFWVSLAEGMTTLADEITLVGPKEAKAILELHKDYADLLDRAPEFFDKLALRRPSWTKIEVHPIPQYLLDEMEDMVHRGVGGPGNGGSAMVAPILDLDELEGRRGGYRAGRVNRNDSQFTAGGYGDRARSGRALEGPDDRNDRHRPSRKNYLAIEAGWNKNQDDFDDDPFAEAAKDDPFADISVQGAHEKGSFQVSVEEPSSGAPSNIDLPKSRAGSMAVNARRVNPAYGVTSPAGDMANDPFSNESRKPSSAIQRNVFGDSGVAAQGMGMMTPIDPMMQRRMMEANQQQVQLALMRQQMMQQQMMQQQMLQQQMLQQQMMMGMGQMNMNPQAAMMGSFGDTTSRPTGQANSRMGYPDTQLDPRFRGF